MSVEDGSYRPGWKWPSVPAILENPENVGLPGDWAALVSVAIANGQKEPSNGRISAN